MLMLFPNQDFLIPFKTRVSEGIGKSGSRGAHCLVSGPLGGRCCVLHPCGCGDL